MKRILQAVLAGLFICISTVSAQTVPQIPVDGAYFDPDNPGWGVILDINQREAEAVAYVFTYTFSGDQAWLVSDPFKFDAPVAAVYAPTGFFPAFDVDIGEPVGVIEFTLTPTLGVLEAITVEWDLVSGFSNGFDQCSGVPPYPLDCHGSARLTPVYPRSGPKDE